jgi:hypothetical protein
MVKSLELSPDHTHVVVTIATTGVFDCGVAVATAEALKNVGPARHGRG